MPLQNKLILLDRDGVINVSPGPGAYVLRPEDFHLEKGAGPAIAKLNAQGIKVAVVTNQSCVGRGYITMAQLQTIHQKMAAELKANGAHVDALYLCADSPATPTPRRKPGPGMLLEALKDFKARADQTPLIGDNLTDIQAAQRVGCPAHLVLTGHGQKHKKALQGTSPVVKIHKNLSDAVGWLLEHWFVKS